MALLSKAALEPWCYRQINAGNAYLCADIASEHVFCSPPEGRARKAGICNVSTKGALRPEKDRLRRGLIHLVHIVRAQAILSRTTTSASADGTQEENEKKIYTTVPVDDCLVIRDDDYIDDFILKSSDNKQKQGQNNKKQQKQGWNEQASNKQIVVPLHF